MKFPYLTEGRIEVAAARTLRDAFGDDVPYPVDLDFLVFEHLCSRDHLIFDDERDLGFEDGDQVLGKTLPRSREILITSALRGGPEGRYRFTVAHEIGHWVLHRPLFLADSSQADLFGAAAESTELVSLNRSIFQGHLAAVPPEEWQANYFAAALLLNEDVLQRAFRDRFGENPLVLRDAKGARAPSLRALSRMVASKEFNGGGSLCGLFGLSKEAMAIALERRGYVVEEAPLL